MIRNVTAKGALLLAILVALACASELRAQTKEITVAPFQMVPVGWCAAPATLESIFANQSIPEGTIVNYWNEATQQYDSITRIYGQWYPQNYQIQSARGFYLSNPDLENHTFYLHYTQRAVGTFTITMQPGKWYWLTYAWELGPDDSENGYWLEQPWAPQRYAGPSLYWNWPPPQAYGDTVYWTVAAAGQEGQYFAVHRFSDSSRMWDQGDQVPPYFWSRWRQPFWFFNNSGVIRTWEQSSEPLDDE